MKKFVFYYPASPNEKQTGGVKSTLNLIKGLQDKGLQTIFISQHEGSLSQRLRMNNVDVEIINFPPVLDVYNKKGLQYSVCKKFEALKEVLKYNYKIIRYVNRHQVEGMWGRGIKSVLLIGFAARWLQKPLIWDIGLEQESRGWMRLFHLLGLGISQKIVTQARVQPREIFGKTTADLFNSKFVTIYPGIADDRVVQLRRAVANDEKNEQTKNILCVGSVHPRKNQLMLLRAFVGVLRRFPEAQLRMAGSVRDEEYYQRLNSFAQSRGIEDNVEFLGWRDDIPALLGSSDLMVLCSYREGVPHVIREAMFAEVPVVATSVGGVPEAVEEGKTGFLVAPDDVEALRARIEHLLARPEERKEMGRAGLTLAQKRFSKEAWLSKYRDLLLNINGK